MNGDFTLNFVSMALDAIALRQQTIAENIAHSSSEGYSAKRIDFEDQLKTLSSNEELNHFKAEVKDTDEAVKIDHELALSLQNTTQYRALIKGLNQKFAIMQLAIRGQ